MVWLEGQKERRIADAKMQTLADTWQTRSAEIKVNDQRIVEVLKILKDMKKGGSEAMQTLQDKCGGILVALQKFHWSCLGGL